MILYCIVSQTFIFDLFVAAIVPALLAIALNLRRSAVVVRLDPSVAPRGERAVLGERFAALKGPRRRWS